MIKVGNRWVVLGLLFLVGLTAPIQFQAVAALAPFLIAGAGLTYTDIGVLTGLYMLPGVLLSAPLGILAARIGDKATVLAGLVLMGGSGAVLAATDSYPVMVAARLVGGAGAVAVTALLPKVVTDWFIGREIATAMASIAASVGLGIGLAAAILPWVAASSSWQMAMHVSTAIVVLGIALLAVIDLTAGSPRGAAGGGAALWQASRAEVVLSAIAGVLRGLFSSGYAVFMSFLPPLLIAKGATPVEAGMMTSLAAAVSLVSVPLGGVLSDRTGKPAYFIVGGSISAATCCVLVPFLAPAVLWIVLFGALRGGCTGGIMALPSEVLRPEARATGFAVASAAYFACMAAFPPIAGYSLDATGSVAAPMLFAAGLWIAITFMLGLFRVLKRRWLD